MSKRLVADINQAAQRLLQGELVAFPTETVYGLGADASNPDAVAAIFAAKGRPSNHPLIVHVAPQADLLQWASHIPAEAQKLIDAFWPGPLTLILAKADSVNTAVTGGQATIGLRCPSHPVAQQLLKQFSQLKGPTQPAGIAAPSANRFGHVSPTQAIHVRDEFAHTSVLIHVVEGGNAEVGIESTIVDVSRVEQGVAPVVLRPGHISAAQIEQVLNRPLGSKQAPDTPRVSGALKAHYAPTTPLYLVKNADLEHLDQANTVLVAYKAPVNSKIHVYKAPAQAELYASQLYAMLRQLDTQGYEAIYVQQPPDTADWEAVNDRLGRAAAAFTPN